MTITPQQYRQYRRDYRHRQQLSEDERIPYVTREMAEAMARYPFVSEAVALEQHRKHPREKKS